MKNVAIVALMWSPFLLLFWCMPRVQATETEVRNLGLTCTVAAEDDSTTNNRPEIVYYTCGSRVSFAVVPDSAPDLHLRDLKGVTVDIEMRVIGSKIPPVGK